MNDETPTIAEIAGAFSGTIFWNYTDPWPGDAQKEPEFELDIIDHGPDPEDGRVKRVSLVFASGEISVGVAEMRPCLPHADAESHVTDADVEFITKLPVYIPVLLESILRLVEAGHAARQLIAKAHGLARECGRELYDTFGAEAKLREAMAFAQAGRVAAAAEVTQ